MPKPARFDFDIYQGRTLRKPWTYRQPRDPETGAVGAPVNITGWHARLIVPADAETDFINMTDEAGSFPVGATITLTDALNGRFEWYIPDEVTDDLDFEAKEREYHFDLQDTAGDWLPMLRGVVRLWLVR